MDLGAVEAARKIQQMLYPNGVCPCVTELVLLREQNAELVAAWDVFYQGLPDGEYAGLGEMRTTMRAIGWDMTAAEKRKRQ